MHLAFPQELAVTLAAAEGDELAVDQGLRALEMLTRQAKASAVGRCHVRAASKVLNAQGLSALHLLVRRPVRRPQGLEGTHDGTLPSSQACAPPTFRAPGAARAARRRPVASFLAYSRPSLTLRARARPAQFPSASAFRA